MSVKRIKDLSTDPEDPSKHKLVDMESNLTVCENVGFEMKDDVLGLAFSNFSSGRTRFSAKIWIWQTKISSTKISRTKISRTKIFSNKNSSDRETTKCGLQD